MAVHLKFIFLVVVQSHPTMSQTHGYIRKPLSHTGLPEIVPVNAVTAATYRLTIGDSGKTFVVNETAVNTTFVLPTAATSILGATYSFVCGADMSGGQVTVQSQSTDYFVGTTFDDTTTNATGVLTLVAIGSSFNDVNNSTGSQGDHITVQCVADGMWIILYNHGTWVAA